MIRDTDQELIEQALNGQSRAYGILVDRYQKLVYTICVRMVKVPEIAEEIAQDTFIKAYESLHTFKGTAKFSSWLYSIAYRKALDSLRKTKRQPSVAFVDELTEVPLDSMSNALSFLEDKERKTVITKAIMQLPEQEASLITFYYFEELSVKEISKITKLSEENIKVKLFRSRKKLFNLLQQYIAPEMTTSNGKAI